MLFEELPRFTKRIDDILDDDQLSELQIYLMDHPESGAVIPSSGGLRKLRWAASGRGKRGGARVIYYWWVAHERITLCRIYTKNEMGNLEKTELKKITKELT